MMQLGMFCPDPAELVPRVESGAVQLVSIEAEKNRYRFYRIVWQRTVWSEWAIQTTWGRIGGQGRSRMACFERVTTSYGPR